MTMTVQDVLNIPQLYELKLRAGHSFVHRIVRWFYVAENESISEWISGGELIFVGVNYIRDETNLLALLDQAKKRDVTAIAILTGESFIEEIPESVIQRAETLELPLIEQPYKLKMIEVTHVIGTRLVELSQVKKSAEDVVSQLLNGDFPSLDTIQMRVKHLNLPVLEEHIIAVIKLNHMQSFLLSESYELPDAAYYQIKQDCYSLIEHWVKQHQQLFPVIRQGDQFNLVLSLNSTSLDQWQAQLVQLIKSIKQLNPALHAFVGISNEVKSAVAFQRGFWEACHAQDIAADLQVENGLCLYRDLGLLKLLKAIPNKSLIQQFMQETIGMLIEVDRKHPYVLLETLDALIKENNNLIATAQRLGIHRNTLNQRIQKIESLNGQSITSANFRLNASVALLIWHMTHK